MFDKLKRLIQGEKKATPKDQPEIPWLSADKNPWLVPVLDVRPVTHHMLSTSTDRACAVNAISFGQEDGTSFANIPPSNPRTVQANLSYRIHRVLAPGVLFIPREMEHKWALFYHGGRIVCVRSWTRTVAATAEVETVSDGTIRVTSIRGTFAGENEDPDFTVRTLDYLIRSHALELIFPAPLPPDLENSPYNAALWCMNLFGKMAACATAKIPKADIPEKPVRTHSLMHIAVARGEIDVVKKHLDSGLPIDLLAGDGLAPLHWAFGREDLAMAKFLIQRGSPVDVRSEQGATPLMTVAKSGNLNKIKFLLDQGADVNAVDLRGFNSLHRVAEKGNIAVVKLLLDHGARIDVSVAGQTALSFAEKRGHTEIAKLLKAK